MDKIRIIGLVGSLRQNSYNKALMDEALKHVPEGVLIEVLSIDLPLYNQDLDTEMPQAVKVAKEKVKDGRIIDEKTREKVAELVLALVEKVKKG